ncbi:diguanylate cyclase [Candidatus Saccharibacteria bacterium]|nr:diguanylate cyclase [Candidatus Saccharibacteria bacterium]
MGEIPYINPENPNLKDSSPIAVRHKIYEELATLEDVPQNAYLRLALLRHLYYTDSVTGLHNGRGLIEDLDRLRAQEECKNFTVFKINIGGFSNINSGFSHEFGDKFLKIFAEELQGIAYRRVNVDDFGSDDRREHSTTASDIVARIQGDEFALILPNSITAERANKIRQDIIGAFDKAKKEFDKQLNYTKKPSPEGSKKEEETVTKPKDILALVTIKTADGSFESASEKSTEVLLSEVEDPVVADANFDLRKLASEVRDAAVRTVHGLLRKDKPSNPENPNVAKLGQDIEELEAQLKDLIAQVDFDPMGDYSKFAKVPYETPIQIEQLSEKYEEAINIDELTGLHNRHWLEEQITGHLESLAKEEQDSDTMMILMIDMGRFSEVNELNSDEKTAGDRVLKRYAEILQTLSQKYSKDHNGNIEITPVRTGGDELHLLIKIHNNQGSDFTPDKIYELSTSILNEIIKPAEDSLRVYLKDSQTVYPNLTTHTGELTEITLADISGEDEFDIAERLRELTSLAEVSKPEQGRLGIITEAVGKIACLGALVEQPSYNKILVPKKIISKLGGFVRRRIIG